MRRKIDITKYDALNKEKKRIEGILKHYNHMKGTPNHNALSAKLKVVRNEIRQLFHY